MKFTCTLVLAGIFCLGIGQSVFAQSTRPQQTFTRIYDIRDLIMSLPAYPYEASFGMPAEEESSGAEPSHNSDSLFGSSTASTRPTERSRQQLTDEIIKIIEESVASDSWKDNGGEPGIMREMSGLLIVTQTPENQKQVQSLLGQLREGQSIVRVQADWILLNPGELDQLLGDAKAKPKQSPADLTPRAVDAAALASLLPNHVHYHGDVSCYTGETVSIASGRSRSIVYNKTAVVAQQAVAMSPMIRQVHEGAMLEITPTVLMGTDVAVARVRSIVAEDGDASSASSENSFATTRPANPAVAGQSDNIPIDKLNLITQELKCQLRVPLNQPILVGGMTLDPSQQTAQAGEMYLILQLSVGK